MAAESVGWAAEGAMIQTLDEVQNMSRERAGQTLQTTAVLNEAYLRLIGSAPLTFEHRAHFFGSAARCNSILRKPRK